MTATAHALVGGAIAASVSNPAVGLPLAAASHPLIDLIPHWDFGWGWKEKSKIRLFLEAAGDLTLGLVLAFVLFGPYTNHLYLFLAVFVAEIWDIMEAPYWFFNWKFPPFSSIYNVQSRMQNKVKLPWGMISQAATVALVMLAFKAL